jgi:hypothetical protein
MSSAASEETIFSFLSASRHNTNLLSQFRRQHCLLFALFNDSPLQQLSLSLNTTTATMKFTAAYVALCAISATAFMPQSQPAFRTALNSDVSSQTYDTIRYDTIRQLTAFYRRFSFFSLPRLYSLVLTSDGPSRRATPPTARTQRGHAE